MAKISAIQLCSVPDVNQNLATITQQLTLLCQQVNDDEHVVVLPECCLFFGGKDAEQLSLAKQTQQSNHLVMSLAKLAEQFKVTLVAGTIPLLTTCGEKFTNTCCVFSPEGVLLGQYSKIHLFDVNVNDNEKTYLESKYTQAGQSVSVVEQATMNIGLSICYDVRFAALYSNLVVQGATLITIPSAFTRVTGKAHWQALLQARAIENQVYIVAAAQEGVHDNGRETWGHSMIISPWGKILVCKAFGEGFITCEYHQEEINRVRAAIPVHEHNKFTVELNKYE